MEEPYYVINDTFLHEYQEILEKLNHERMIFQLPVIVTLLVAMVLGVFGNVIVICVYRLTCKSSVASFFITLLAVVDLITALCIPFNIQDMLHPYLNAAPVVCKIGRFLESFMAVLSGNLLVCIAFDRYFHIIYPLKRYTLQQAKSLTIVMTAVALCLSWPQLFLAGKRTAATTIEGIFGEDCSFRDGVHNSIYTLLFQGMLTLSFIIGLSVFVIFYGRIYFVIWRRHKITIGEQVPISKKGKVMDNSDRLELKGQVSNQSIIRIEHSLDTTSKSGVNNNEITSLVIQIEKSEDRAAVVMNSNTVDTDITSDELKLPYIPIPDYGSDKHVRFETNPTERARSPRNTMTHTTRIMFIVTVCGIMGFLPYLFVNIFKNNGVFFKPGMSAMEDLVYEFCTKSHFLNSFVNPIIYSIMNPKFRSDAWNTVNKLTKIQCFNKRF